MKKKVNPVDSIREAVENWIRGTKRKEFTAKLIEESLLEPYDIYKESISNVLYDLKKAGVLTSVFHLEGKRKAKKKRGVYAIVGKFPFYREDIKYEKKSKTREAKLKTREAKLKGREEFSELEKLKGSIKDFLDEVQDAIEIMTGACDNFGVFLGEYKK